MKIIKDKSIKPYVINSSANGYSVEKNYKNEEGGISSTNIGFYSSIEACLVKIIRLKAEPKKAVKLKEYIKVLKAVKEDVFKAFEIKDTKKENEKELDKKIAMINNKKKKKVKSNKKK